jgi:type VI secretion system protein ImpJ
MTSRQVHWHEGMFLTPHHFQALQQHWFDQAQRGEKWDLHYNWGLRAIDLDREALANHRLVVRSLQARLRDGTLVAVPEDGTLPELPLQPVLERDSAVDVFLAVPVLRVGRANISATGGADGTRYLVDIINREDENTGDRPQPVQVRLLNLKLLFSTQDHAGYETLPIARIEKSARAEAVPQLHLPYIPPVLACDAWQPLAAGVLQVIYDRIGKKLDLLAAQITSRGISFGSQAPGDALLFGQLQALNEASAVLHILSFAGGVHPLPAYLELCRLVGQLAIFGDSRRTPELPRYDHDDLGGCFNRVKNYIDALLDQVVEPDYKERPFVGAGQRMQVSLEPSWLESAWQMYIGVQSPLPAEEAIRLLTRGGQLDMKVGSSERVERIFQLRQAGLKFAHSPLPARALPARAGLIYFQINREAQQEEWQNVQRSLTLAIRLNEQCIVGSIEGERVLTIRTGTGAQTTTLQFTLYVVREEP